MFEYLFYVISLAYYLKSDKETTVVNKDALGYNVIMKIGINASFARKPYTGIGQVTLNFLQKLSNFQFPISLASPDPAKRGNFQNCEFILYLEEDFPKGFKLPKNSASLAGKFEKRIFLPLWKRDDLIRKIWWEKILLPKKVKKDKCDVFLSLYQSATILPKKIPHIMVVHDIIPKLFPSYLNNARKKKYQNLIENAIRKADKIVAVSSRTEKDLIKHLEINSKKISVSYIDVDPIYKESVSREKSAKILKKYNLSSGYIYNGGGLEARKNIEKLIRAYKVLMERNGNEKFSENFPKLVVSGKLLPKLAPLATDAEKLVKELNLTENVKLLDFIPQEDLPALYENASFFIYPSLYEGFGIPVLEAMNRGIPVIASKKSSLPEVGGDGVLYCDPESVSDMVMVMKNLMKKRNLRETLSKRGKERAKNFSWEKFTEKILNIMSEIK